MLINEAGRLSFLYHCFYLSARVEFTVAWLAACMIWPAEWRAGGCSSSCIACCSVCDTERTFSFADGLAGITRRWARCIVNWQMSVWKRTLARSGEYRPTWHKNTIWRCHSVLTKPSCWYQLEIDVTRLKTGLNFATCLAKLDPYCDVIVVRTIPWFRRRSLWQQLGDESSISSQGSARWNSWPGHRVHEKKRSQAPATAGCAGGSALGCQCPHVVTCYGWWLVVVSGLLIVRKQYLFTWPFLGFL